MPSESTENYLTELLRLEERGVRATTSELADRLAVARPSVSGMLERLAEDGFVVRERYRPVRLTRRGRAAARRVLHRHRLIETFLVDILGLPADRVHAEAHRLEHAMSDEVVQRLDRWLGHPRHDPHGTPIPRPGNRAGGGPRRCKPDPDVPESHPNDKETTP